jgi:hypothetical protein
LAVLQSAQPKLVSEVFVQHLPSLMICSAARDWVIANSAAMASAKPVAIADLRILLSLGYEELTARLSEAPILSWRSGCSLSPQEGERAPAWR